MSYDIRRIDPDADYVLYEQMYEWTESAPKWLRESTAAFGTLSRSDYIEGARWDRRIDIGIFDDGKLIACVTLILILHRIYEVHLEASRDADPALIIAAGCDIRDQLFGQYGAYEAFMWTPVWNRTVRRINKALGFEADNVSMFRGVSHGKLIEWRRYSIRSTTDGRNQNTATASTAATAEQYAERAV